MIELYRTSVNEILGTLRLRIRDSRGPVPNKNLGAKGSRAVTHIFEGNQDIFEENQSKRASILGEAT
jgi:hypothetical protein